MNKCILRVSGKILMRLSKQKLKYDPDLFSDKHGVNY